MYNLAPRFPKRDLSGTPDNVGPDTYTICYSTCGRRKNRAPFLSCQGRKFSIARPVYTHELYSYDTRNRIIGGASINYTAERKTIVKTKEPGPGDYEPKLNVCRAVREIVGKGRVYVCRVPYSHEISTPSVPTRINENGYNIKFNGRLERIPPDDHDETIGPAFYCVPAGEISCTTRRYKGCRWSCRSAKRGDKFDNNIPGPGAYCVELPKCRKNEEDEDFRALARHFSYVPRFSDAQALNACKEDKPGPAEYNVSSKLVKIDPRGKSIEPRPFISGAERLKTKIDKDIPAPCQYNVTSDVYKKKQFSTICAPFAVKDNRWHAKHMDNEPGPGHYEIKSFVDENMDKMFNKYSLVEVGFGTLAERDTLNIGDAICLPGPGYYDDKKEFKEEKCTASVFKSQTARFKEDCSEGDVGPAKYNITKIYKKMRDRKSHHTGDVPFLSSAKRLPDYDQDAPGVGDYILPEIRPNATTISSVGRPECLKGDDAPGPGSYEIATLMHSCIAKAFLSHNIRIKEQILRKKLRKAPYETRKQFYKSLKKRKILEVFKHKFVEPEKTDFKDLDIIS